MLVTPRPEALERVERLPARHAAARVSAWLDRMADDDLQALARGLAALAGVADADRATDPSDAAAAASAAGGRR